MTAVTYVHVVEGATPLEAYANAVREYRKKRGFSRTGSVADSSGFTTFERPPMTLSVTVKKAVLAAERLVIHRERRNWLETQRLIQRYRKFPLKEMSERFEDRNGLAGVMRYSTNQYIIWGLGTL